MRAPKKQKLDGGSFLRQRLTSTLATNPTSAKPASSPSRSTAISGRTSGRARATRPTSTTPASSPSRSTAISGRTSGRTLATNPMSAKPASSISRAPTSSKSTSARTVETEELFRDSSGSALSARTSSGLYALIWHVCTPRCGRTHSFGPAFLHKSNNGLRMAPPYQSHPLHHPCDLTEPQARSRSCRGLKRAPVEPPNSDRAPRAASPVPPAARVACR